jgi:hypothetical protein
LLQRGCGCGLWLLLHFSLMSQNQPIQKHIQRSFLLPCIVRMCVCVCVYMSRTRYTHTHTHTHTLLMPCHHTCADDGPTSARHFAKSRAEAPDLLRRFLVDAHTMTGHPTQVNFCQLSFMGSCKSTLSNWSAALHTLITRTARLSAPFAWSQKRLAA